MDRNGQPAAPPNPVPAIVEKEGPLATGERFRPFALAALTVVLIALCVFINVPFLPAVTWGVALAVIAWPLHVWVLARVTENRTGAAGLTALVVVLAVAVPGVFVTRQIAREAVSAADQMREEHAKATVRDRLARTPGMGEVVGWLDRTGIDLDAEARKAVQSYFGDPSALAQGSLWFLLQSLIAVFILYYMLRDRRELLAGVRKLLPMKPVEIDRVCASAACSVYANLYANLVTSAIDGVCLGLMFWLVGLPSPVTWGVITFVISLLPVLGIFLIWVPAAVYLALIGNWGGAAALVAWGVGASIIVDTVLFTRLAGNRMHVHQVPAMIAFLGGLVVFGASGMILGPGILAVTIAVLEVWHYRTTGEPLPRPEEAPAVAPAPRPEPAPEPIGTATA